MSRPPPANHSSVPIDGVLEIDCAFGHDIAIGEPARSFEPGRLYGDAGPNEAGKSPHRDVADFTELTDAEKDELATMYLDLLARVDHFFEGVEKVPYIAGWHQAPVGSPAGSMRLHLNLFSLMRSPNRMKFLAGPESAMEVWVNDTTPEKIAERFREISDPLP